MGIAIPQVITPSKASGAQVIDGSLKFDELKKYFKRTPSSAGNRRTWTWSGWVKRRILPCRTGITQIDLQLNRYG